MDPTSGYRALFLGPMLYFFIYFSEKFLVDIMNSAIITDILRYRALLGCNTGSGQAGAQGSQGPTVPAGGGGGGGGAQGAQGAQ